LQVYIKTLQKLQLIMQSCFIKFLANVTVNEVLVKEHYETGPI